MKKIELLERKRIIKDAKKDVIKFINSFDFDSYNDLGIIESTPFNILFTINGNGTKHDKALFKLCEGNFVIATASSEDEICSLFTNIKEWKDITDVFDSTCVFIDFKGLMESMEDFIAKINKAVLKKEQEIINFQTLNKNEKVEE